MKKFTLFLLASFTLAQTLFAATSHLETSKLEHDILFTAIDSQFANVIGENEHIFSVRRQSRDILNEQPITIKYSIKTFLPDQPNNLVTSLEEVNLALDCNDKTAKKKHAKVKIYEAIMILSPNPNNPPNVTVTEFKCKKHCNSLIVDAKALAAQEYEDFASQLLDFEDMEFLE